MKFFWSLIPIGCLLLPAGEDKVSQPEYTVHEWGTFTSIADDSGMAMDWQPFGGPSDLPCFVHRFQIGFKASLAGTVRMETPVIYFYTPHAMTARVHVAFPKGYITEWYPAAMQVARPMGSGSNPATGDVSRNSGIRSPRPGEPDSIEWPEVKIDPTAPPKYPFEFESSRYYTARSVDSAPLTSQNESEGFLFYRGVGEFQPPVSVQYLKGDQLRIRDLARDPLPAVIVFQNTNGKISYRLLGSLSGEIAAELPRTENNWNTLERDFESVLTAQGLFPAEAKAMVGTWRDSWFEEGTRVFYVSPPNESSPSFRFKLSLAPSESLASLLVAWKSSRQGCERRSPPPSSTAIAKRWRNTGAFSRRL